MSDTPKPGNPRRRPTATPRVSEPGGTAETPSGPDTATTVQIFGPRKGKGGKPGRSGPPKGNVNAIRHGLKAGKLPADAKYIEVRLNIFRRNLEQAVLDCKGEVNLADAAAIQTAIRWERHAALAQRWLTKQYNELKPTDRLTFSREIARASCERDKAIRELELDRDVVQDAWATFDALPAPEKADE